MGGGLSFFTSSKNDETVETERAPLRSWEEENEYLERRAALIALYGEKPAEIFKDKFFESSSTQGIKQMVAKNHAVLRESWYADSPTTEERKKAVLALDVTRADAITSKPELVDGIEEILWSAAKDPDQKVAAIAIQKVYWFARHLQTTEKSAESMLRLCDMHASEERNFVKVQIREQFVFYGDMNWVAEFEDKNVALRIVDMLGDAPTFSPAYCAVAQEADKGAMKQAIKEDDYLLTNLKSQSELALNRDIVRKQRDKIAKKVLNTLIDFSKDVRNEQTRITAINEIAQLAGKKPLNQVLDPDFDKKAFTALSDAALHEKDQEKPSESVVFAATSAMWCLLAHEGFAAENDIINRSKENGNVPIEQQGSQFLQLFHLAADTYISLMEDPSESIREDARKTLQSCFGIKDNMICEKYFDKNLRDVRLKVQGNLDRAETIGKNEQGYLKLLVTLACAPQILEKAPKEAMAIVDYLEAQFDDENKKEALRSYIEVIASKKEIAPYVQLPFLSKAGIFEFRENAEEANKVRLEVMSNLSYGTAFEAMNECGEKLDAFNTEGKKLTEILDNPVVQWLYESHIALESNLTVS